MYEIERKDKLVVVSDWKGQIIYSVPEGSYVVFKGAAGEIVTARVGSLSDEKLLQALAKAVKLDI